MGRTTSLMGWGRAGALLLTLCLPFAQPPARPADDENAVDASADPQEEAEEQALARAHRRAYLAWRRQVLADAWDRFAERERQAEGFRDSLARCPNPNVRALVRAYVSLFRGYKRAVEKLETCAVQKRLTEDQLRYLKADMIAAVRPVPVESYQKHVDPATAKLLIECHRRMLSVEERFKGEIDYEPYSLQNIRDGIEAPLLETLLPAVRIDRLRSVCRSLEHWEQRLSDNSYFQAPDLSDAERLRNFEDQLRATRSHLDRCRKFKTFPDEARSTYKELVACLSAWPKRSRLSYSFRAALEFSRSYTCTPMRAEATGSTASFLDEIEKRMYRKVPDDLSALLKRCTAMRTARIRPPVPESFQKYVQNPEIEL